MYQPCALKQINPIQITKNNYVAKEKDLYKENIQTPNREIIEDTKWWKELKCSWIDKVSILKMDVRPKLTYRFNEIAIKVPMSYFMGLEYTIQAFLWTHKIQHVNLRVMVIKIVWYWDKKTDKYTDRVEWRTQK